MTKKQALPKKMGNSNSNLNARTASGAMMQGSSASQASFAGANKAFLVANPEEFTPSVSDYLGRPTMADARRFVGSDSSRVAESNMPANP